MDNLDPADVLDHASEIAIGSRLALDTTKKLPAKDSSTWLPFIKMDESIREKINALFDK